MEELRIERDAPVFVAGREVGRLTHVIVDPQTKEVTEVVVAHAGRESTVPIAAVVGAGGGAIRLRDTAGAATFTASMTGRRTQRKRSAPATAAHRCAMPKTTR